MRNSLSVTLSLTLSLFTVMFAACDNAPREVATTAPATPAAPAPPASTVATGHGSSAAASEPMTQAPPPPQAAAATGDAKWAKPARWNEGGPKPMRAATYLIPAAAGDADGGECAVFVNIGGGTAANIDRWVGQFEQPDGGDSKAKAKRGQETINGLSVTTVDLTGTFKGGGAAMGSPSTPKTGYRLLGAIAETPSGPIYFKLTGPAKTVAAAQTEFQTMLKSLRK